MFYIRRDYYCPKCGKWQSFLSLLPVLGDRWRCRACGKKFALDATCIGSNWAIVAGLWSMPLTFLAGELYAVVEVVQTARLQHTPITNEALIRDIISPLVCGGPLIMLMGSFLLVIVGYFVGLMYGYNVTKKL
jgi:hypothetical protein